MSAPSEDKIHEEHADTKLIMDISDLCLHVEKNKDCHFTVASVKTISLMYSIFYLESFRSNMYV